MSTPAAPEAPARFIPSPKVRTYIYTVLVAAGPVVCFYGLMTAQEFALWAGLGGTVLAPAGLLAIANTPKKGA